MGGLHPLFFSPPPLPQLNEAYEEVEEHRQSVAQWKRKTQKAHGEMSDVKMILEEQVRRRGGGEHFRHRERSLLDSKMKNFMEKMRQVHRRNEA